MDNNKRQNREIRNTYRRVEKRYTYLRMLRAFQMENKSIRTMVLSKCVHYLAKANIEYHLELVVHSNEMEIQFRFCLFRFVLFCIIQEKKKQNRKKLLINKTQTAKKKFNQKSFRIFTRYTFSISNIVHNKKCDIENLVRFINIILLNYR